MTPLISEFSFGFAITNELVLGAGNSLTAAPIFPSLYEEGQAGGGFDVRIPRQSSPLFLQFKLSHCLTNRNAAEANILDVPYYRMYFMPARRSRQHELLLALESAGHDVAYCAPGFHRESELNQAYLARQVCERSIWIAPSSAGPLPDDATHYAVFQTATAAHYYFCSNPKAVDTDCSFSALSTRLEKSVTLADGAQDVNAKFADLGGRLRQLGESLGLGIPPFAEQSLAAGVSPIAQAGILATSLFGAHLYMVYRA